MPANSKKTQYDIQYAKDKLKRIPLNVQKEKYEEIKTAASTAGETVNGYIKRAIDMRMEADQEAPKQETPVMEQIEPQSVEQEAEQVKENAFKPFTDAEREQIDYERLPSDILLQCEIMQNYGSDVLAQLLEQARAAAETPEAIDETTP